MARRFVDRGSNEIAAKVMATVAVSPGKYSVSDLAVELDASPGSVSREAKNLAAYQQWIQTSGQRNGSIACKELSPAPEFWNAYNGVVSVIHQVFDLKPELEPVFTDVVTARRELGGLNPETGEFFEQQVTYLGGVAVLGGQVDLHDATSGLWFADEPGWRAIVDIQATRVPVQ